VKQDEQLSSGYDDREEFDFEKDTRKRNLHRVLNIFIAFQFELVNSQPRNSIIIQR